MRHGIEDAAKALSSVHDIAIVCHMNPDGDAIGSSMALKNLLEQMGKKAEVYNRDKVPDILRMIDGGQNVKPLETLPDQTEALVFLDCADYQRVAGPNGSEALDRTFRQARHRIQIDHHGTNPLYCEINTVEECPATAVLIWRLARHLGLEIDQNTAEWLYAALATDTGNFTQDNADAESFRMMDDLMQCGIRLVPLCRALFSERSRPQVSLISDALSTLRYSEDGRVTCMYLTAEDMKRAGARSEDADTVVNFGRDIQGVDMTFLARETPDGIRFSFRSVAPWRVDMVAKAFGGGGHPQAGGCTMKCGLQEAVDQAWKACLQAHRAQEEA